MTKKKFKNIQDFDLSNINLNSKYDNKIITLIKKLLQTHLPTNIRKYVLDVMFQKMSDISTNDFAKEIYMNKKDIDEMVNNKMSFGMHGYDHLRWGQVSKEKLKTEINKSLDFLKKIDVKSKKFSVSYPYGSYNSDLLKILKRKEISFALTTQKGIVKK